MAKQSKIHFILTGGTIDSFYNPPTDAISPNKRSVIPQFIKGLKLYDEFEFTQICMKDSRQLTTRDTKNMCETIKKSPHKKIIIAHGTYTMPDTARYLQANLKNNDKTIIIVGSMIPLTGFIPSDAPFNLGYAIGKIQDLPKGIYVCMNGKVFSPNEIIKTISEGRFYSIFNK